MTTKSPVSTWGAKVALCLPRSSTATWLASRPSTTSVASMTCHWRSTSPGFGVYVRTVVAFVSSRVVGRASAPAGLSVELVPDHQRLQPLARAHDDSPGYLPRSAGVKTPQRACFRTPTPPLLACGSRALDCAPGGAMSRPPLPPFDRASAERKVQAAEDAWNT